MTNYYKPSTFLTYKDGDDYKCACLNGFWQEASLLSYMKRRGIKKAIANHCYFYTHKCCYLPPVREFTLCAGGDNATD